MPKRGKKYMESIKKVDPEKIYSLEDGIKLALEASYVKFDETLDVALKLGVDPRHADQMVRGSVVLPNGTGKDVKVLVFARGEKAKEAEEAGADFVGAEDIAEKIQGGWLEFDKAIATPDMMAVVGKLGKVLGPRGLMPNPKSGTVTMDVTKAINETKAGKIEFRVEKAGIVHASVGKKSFGYEKLFENIKSLLETVQKLKPSSSKGAYFRAFAVSTTMGPGIKVDTAEIKDIIK